MRARIAGFKTPKQIVFLPELPKTPAGKIKKHEVKQALLAAPDDDRASPTVG